MFDFNLKSNQYNVPKKADDVLYKTFEFKRRSKHSFL